MVFGVAVAAIGFILGRLRGGSFRQVAHVEIKALPLVFGAVVIQVVAEILAATVAPGLASTVPSLAILTCSYLLVVVFLVMNRSLTGTLIIAVGFAMNLVAILSNGGMPVSVSAARSVGFDPSDYLKTSVKHVAVDSDTRLLWLCDVIPVPGVAKVISVGDIVLSIGLVLTASSAMTARSTEAAGGLVTENTL